MSLAMIALAAFASSNAQVSYSNANSRMTATTPRSGNSVTIVDFNGDGLDDIVRLDQGVHVYVEIQKTGSQFQTLDLGDFGQGNGWAWGMCVADIDKNGYMDVVAGGYGPAVKAMMTNGTGTGATIVNLPGSNFFLQNLTFCDANNDGWIDLFCCDDNAAAHLYTNDGAGNLVVSSLINFAVNGGTIGSDPADSGNYGSVWTDFDGDGDMDLFVAHCRQAAGSLTDVRRKDRLFVNDGSNNYTEQASTYNIEPVNYNQTWTASFGDIDNDLDLDLMLTNHNTSSQIFLNDGTGYYTDATAGSGFNIDDITPYQSQMEDFDNDGNLDMFVTGGGGGRYFLGHGDGTFTKIMGLFDANEITSFATGDLNHDGMIDIYTSYCDGYNSPSAINDVIWMGTKNSNHFFTLNLKGTVSNKGAIGANAIIYGSWGAQMREVRAGESYGTVNSAMLHFGLASATAIDSVVINWPSGGTQTITNPAADQFLTVIEGDCISPDVTITASTPTGSFVICPGQSVTLSAPAGFNYLWSDGSTAQDLVVTATGDYTVQVSAAGNNCVGISTLATVINNPDETPVVSSTDDLEFCDGSSATLQGPVGLSSYLWSNGDTTQTTVVNSSSTVTLTIQGTCQPWTSAPVNIISHTVATPTATDIYIATGTSGTINATSGTNVTWYDAATGGNLLGSGNAFNTPVLTNNTIYYAQSTEVFGGFLTATGQAYHTGNSQYSGSGATNALTYFDVLDNATLLSVKVYTDLPGTRLIELRDNAGNLVNSTSIDIQPDTQVIALNWSLTPGLNYSIGTNATVNQAIPTWGNDGPRLRRTNGNVSYPYVISNILSINSSSQGNNLFYYFYDWQVQVAGVSCNSDRTPVNVFVTPNGINSLANEGMSIYPNPANSNITLHSNTSGKTVVNVFDATSRLVKSICYESAEKNIDITELPSGMYHIEVLKNNQSGNYKLVVQ